eukprot:7324570-Pyramimonas_sp.AAC.1
MARLLGRAWARLSAPPENKVWSGMGGPASALVGATMRLGWKLLDPFRWMTHRGPVLIEKMSPRDVG